MVRASCNYTITSDIGRNIPPNKITRYPFVFRNIRIIGRTSVAGSIINAYQTGISRAASLVSHGNWRFATTHSTFFDAKSTRNINRQLESAHHRTAKYVDIVSPTYVAAFQGLDEVVSLFGEGLLLVILFCFTGGGVPRLPIVHYSWCNVLCKTFPNI